MSLKSFLVFASTYFEDLSPPMISALAKAKPLWIDWSFKLLILMGREACWIDQATLFLSSTDRRRGYIMRLKFVCNRIYFYLLDF